MAKKPTDILDETADFWIEKSGRQVSREEARQMVANVAGFIGILAEWDRQINGEQQQERKENQCEEDQS